MDPQLHALLAQLGSAALQALLPLVGTAVGSLASWLLLQLINHVKNQQLQMEIQMAVAFAEQQIQNNPDKLAYVTNWLKQRTGGKLDDQTMSHMIENAVLALNLNQQSSASSSAPAPANPPASQS